MCLQRGYILLAEQQEQNASFRRVAEARRDIENSQQANFRGTFYPHSSVIQRGGRAAEYGQGEEANTFLAYGKRLQIGMNVQMRLADLHMCPKGSGDCSYSGMIEIDVDGGHPIVVDVFGIGTDDANWFSVRDGMEVMHTVAAAMGYPATNGNRPSAAPRTQEDFQRTIKQCWQERHNDSPEVGGKPSPREQALHELGSSILLAICHAWHSEMLGGTGGS